MMKILSKLLRRPAASPRPRGAVLCIVDGMSDEGFYVRDFPNLQAMKQEGAFGTFHTVPAGFMAESYPCIATLLGLRAEQIPVLARGYLDALGAGIAMYPDDLILRASWIRLDGQKRLLGPAAPPGVPPLPPGCDYFALEGYRALLIVHHAAAKLSRLATFAPHAYAGQPLELVMPAGEERLAEIVRLSCQGDTVLIPWGQAIPCELPSFPVSAAAVGAALIARGLARAMGMDVYSGPGMSGDTNTNLAEKTALTLALTERYSLVLLHINGADEAAHRRDEAQKREFLLRVDETVISGLKRAGLPFLVCCDHGSSPDSGRHLGGAQPFLLAGTARRGNLGALPGYEASKILLEENHG